MFMMKIMMFLMKMMYGEPYDFVINYGTAASKIHSGLVDCTKFIQRDMDVTALGFKIGEDEVRMR